ncbi:MAG: two-component system, NtrC family, response regulator AtoC [Pyrinomonadaceae bacterium]|nr:two-component system, NtrC family, response regulator AtoC [Pyrinomonadaceae bacterium]
MTQKRSGDAAINVLIVDDEEAARYGVRRALASLGYEIAEAGSVAEARTQFAQRAPDLLLLDVNLPGQSGLEFLRELHGAEVAQTDAPLVILITAHGSERMAVEAIKTGAYDYLSKPFEVEDLRLVVKNAVETITLRRENQSLRERIELEGAQRGSLIGNSESMRRVRSLIEKVSETDATVLVRGESGTGKELVARELHERSTARRRGAFIAVNCAALPSELIESELFGHEKGAFTGATARRQGKFEQADGGTLFLDEIGDMSANVQAKLLRALEERRIERLGGGAESIPVDVRIVSATHRPLEQEIEKGNFRADLFYRLRVVTVDIAPLRERREDIPALAESFIRLAAERYNMPVRAIAPAAMRRLVEYDWPGNVRELRNAVERAMVLAEGDELTARDLPEEIDASRETFDAAPPRLATGESGGSSSSGDDLPVPFTADFRADRREFERRYITRCLEETGGNVTRAAAILGMHRQSLQHKLRELGLARRYVTLDGDTAAPAPDKSDN